MQRSIQLFLSQRAFAYQQQLRFQMERDISFWIFVHGTIPDKVYGENAELILGKRSKRDLWFQSGKMFAGFSGFIVGFPLIYPDSFLQFMLGKDLCTWSWLFLTTASVATIYNSRHSLNASLDIWKTLRKVGIETDRVLEAPPSEK